MKIIKIIGISLLSLTFLYVAFVAEEAIRLKNGGQAPVIIISGTCDGDKMGHIDDYTTNCKSLGFRLEREYILDDKSSDDNKMFQLIKEEFWLFDKFLLWGWIS